MKRFLCTAALLGSILPAQTSIHATRVVAYDDQGQAGGGIFHPPSVLGRPNGAVSSLGIGGWITLGFDVVITDGPGADLIVAENAFYSGAFGSSFAETMFVEVSSDGTTFARVPNAYVGPAVSPGAFGVINVGAYEGLVGATPANTATGDPADVVEAGGDAIDLADLRGHPLVVSGAVDLAAIVQVRLVDVRSGLDRDSSGVLIHDPGGGSADPDGVTVIHHTGNLDPNGPTVRVVIPPDGAFELAFDDPDGWLDLDLASVQTAIYGVPVPLWNLLPAMLLTRLGATGFTLKLGGPLPSGLLLRVSASVRDRAGNRSGDTRSRVR